MPLITNLRLQLSHDINMGDVQKLPEHSLSPEVPRPCLLPSPPSTYMGNLT